MYKHILFQILKGILVIGTIVGVYLLVSSTIMYIYPFIIAFLISFFINPIVTMLEQQAKFPRPLATLTVILTIFIGVFGIIFIMITELIQGTHFLAEQIPIYFQSFITIMDNFINTKVILLYQKLISLFHTLNPSQQITIKENIQQLTNHIATTGTSFLQNFFMKMPSFLALLPNSITVFIFITLATFFITNDWHSLRGKIVRLVPASIQAFLKNVMIHLKKALVGYVKAQLILVFITACIIYSGLLLLKTEHALTITLFAALFDLLPIIGTGLIFIPWIIYLFVTGSYSLTIGLTILFMIIVIIRQILEPKIFSASIGINPLLGLFVLFISVQLWGLTGIFIAPGMLILLTVLFEAGIIKYIWLFIKSN